MNRDGLVAGADFQLDLVVLQQQPELLQVIIPKQIGVRQRRLEPAGSGNKAETQLHAIAGIAPGHRVGLYPHKGVAGARHARHGVAVHVALHGLAQMRESGVVNLLGLGQGSSRVGETCRCDRRG